MSQTVKNFIQKVIETHSSGHAREHSYRPALGESFKAVAGFFQKKLARERSVK